MNGQNCDAMIGAPYLFCVPFSFYDGTPQRSSWKSERRWKVVAEEKETRW